MKVMVMTDMKRHGGGLLWVFLVLWVVGSWQIACGQAPPLLRTDVVIHEIHYNPDVKTEPVEFIEIYNTGTSIVDLSGWSLVDAVVFPFPEGTTLTPGGLVV